MIFQNQQANIFRVNGALADNFANRPASQGTYYIFYSLDTQEIFYDDVSGWILLGSGGGGTPVNIYNSDGTLTGSRIVNGNSSNLVFNNLASLNISTSNGTQFIIVNNQIKTIYQNNDIGLKLDFANNLYQFGQITGGNTNTLNINDTTNTITTTRGGQTRGLSLNLNSQNYGFGSFGGGNGTALTINDGNQIISTQTNAGVNGIILNFNAQNYVFGHGSSGLRTQLLIDNISGTIQTRLNINPNGFSLDGFNGIYTFGCCNFSNRINFQIENTNKRFVTFHDGGQINGFDIVISTDIYKFGRIQGNNTTNLTINDAAAFPVQINGTNVLQGTSGAVSGQHLKIKVNGVDYVIELKNP